MNTKVSPDLHMPSTCRCVAWEAVAGAEGIAGTLGSGLAGGGTALVITGAGKPLAANLLRTYCSSVTWVFSDTEIAMMAYELNRGYNHAIGDPWTDPPWSGIPQWYRDALCDGVRAVRAGMTRRQLHENWCRYYWALGWKHGPVKDANGCPPTHPCLIDYEDLPAEHRKKTAIFREVVQMLLRIG